MADRVSGQGGTATWEPRGATWGAHWSPFIGDQAPWVVHKPVPKFGRVPIGFRQGKPFPNRTLLPIPKLDRRKVFASQGNVARPLWSLQDFPRSKVVHDSLP